MTKIENFENIYFILTGEDYGFKFDDFMKFLTGMDSVPPLGLPGSIVVQFVHGCSSGCACKPSVSTCAMSISVPVHYNTRSSILQALVDGITLSYGFDEI